MNDAGPTNAFLAFTDADLKVALRRAFRTILVLGAILFVIVSAKAGWQSGMLLLAGAVISASGVFEAQRLIAAVNAHLDNAETGKSPSDAEPGHAEKVQPMGRVIGMFFLRLMLAGAVLYGSLKCFHGSVYALVAGLCLAIVGLSIEAVRLVKL